MQYICSYHPYRISFLHPLPEDAPCRGDSDSSPRGKPKESEKDLSHCYFIHQESYDGLILTKPKYWEKNVPALFLSPQTPHDPTWDCYRACALRNWRLAVLAIVRPGINVGWGYGMDSSGCGCGLMVGSPGHCDEFSASINGEKFLDKPSKC
jgi:hypothetical protein